MISQRSSRAAAAFAVSALVLAPLMAGCGSAPSAVERPDTVVDADRPPGYVFESLPRLVATSNVVVVGTVQSSEKGARVVPDDELYHRKVLLRVEEQFYGSPVKSTIVIHEGGHDGNESFELREQPWLYPGDRAVYFLAHAPTAKPNHYDIVAAPGRFAIEADGTVSSQATDPVARQLDGRSWSVLARRLREAVQVVQERDIQPLPPGPFGNVYS